jgi:hypothetical protein
MSGGGHSPYPDTSLNLRETALWSGQEGLARESQSRERAEDTPGLCAKCLQVIGRVRRKKRKSEIGGDMVLMTRETGRRPLCVPYLIRRSQFPDIVLLSLFTLYFLGTLTATRAL